MSSGKKSQRTKGNVKPSSSARAAKFLDQEGNTGFIGFTGLAGNTPGYVPQVKNEENELDGDLRMLLRKMTKKDSVTKLKAIQQFTELCKTKDDDVILNILSFWPRIYHKLAYEFDHRVREATQQANHQIVTKAGRNLAPHLKLIITDWLMSMFDTYAPSASAANIAFDQVFQQASKKNEVLSFCKIVILEALQNHILKETMDTLSDPKVVPIEEREAKFSRFISSSFHTLSYFLKMMDSSQLNDDGVVECFRNMLNNKVFWKFVKNDSTLIRNACFKFLTFAMQNIPEVTAEVLPMLCPASLTHLDEQEPTVVQSMWDAVLLCLTTYKEKAWEHVNSRKAVFPNLWKVLKNCGFGNVTVVYPNLLPLLTNIPVKVTGEGSGFFIEYFGNFLEGLHSKQNVLTASDLKLMIKSYMEGVHFLLAKRSGDSELVAFLIKSQLKTVLKEAFLSEDPRQMWYGMLFVELRSMLKSISVHSDHHQPMLPVETIEKQTWDVIWSTVFSASEEKDGIWFQSNHRNFFDSLLDFLFCFYSNANGVKGESPSIVDIGCSLTGFNGYIFRLVKDCVSAYTLILRTQKFDLKQDFVKILDVALCKPLLVHAINCTDTEVNTKSGDFATSDDDLEVAQTFVRLVAAPLLSDADSVYVVNLLVAMLKLLANTDKEKYLNFLLEGFMTTDVKKMSMLAEVFTYKDDTVVADWLRSELVQQIIVQVCDSDVINQQVAVLRWNILNVYCNMIRDDRDRFATYCERVFDLMTAQLNRYYVTKISNAEESKEEINALLVCFSSLCSNGAPYSRLFLEVWLCILKRTMDKRGGKMHEDCVWLGLKTMCIQSDEEFHKIIESFAQSVSQWLNALASESMVCEICKVIKKLEELSTASKQLDVVVIDQFFQESFDIYNSGEGLLAFQAELLAQISTHNICSLQKKVNREFLLSSIQLMLLSSDAQVKAHLEITIKNTEYLYKELIKAIIQKSSASRNTKTFTSLLTLLSGQNALNEELVDYCLQLCIPTTYSSLQCVDEFTAMVPFIRDISCIRAFVVRYSDELQNDVEVKNNVVAFTCSITSLTTVLRRWFELSVAEVSSTKEDLQIVEGVGINNDYANTILETLDILLVWKEEHGDEFLFATDLNDVDKTVIALNAQFVHLLTVAVTTCVDGLRNEHWDFILCSLLSWLQSCQESFVYQIANSKFFINALSLAYIVASIFEQSKEPLSFDSRLIKRTPSVALPLCVPILNASKQDMVTEWNEFFQPAVGASVMSMFNAVVDTNQFNREDEFSRTLCACCTFIPLSVISEQCFDVPSNRKKNSKKSPSEEFFLSMCTVMERGSWCYKLASLQLQSKMSERIEQFCVDHEEDENQEETRSFPEALLNCMEKSRNETLKCLSEHQASIIEPLQTLERCSDKTSLLTYLLSWQLIIQVFQISSLDKRAKLANYLHKTSHVTDLMTCLFCMMPSSPSSEKATKPDGVLEFTYARLQRIAVSLLTNSMQCIPALLRYWFKNHLNRNETTQIDRFVSSNISPVLLRNEFQRLDDAFKTFDNMIVKTRPIAREVAAIYTIEEISMELVVKLATNYPLSPVTVECGKRIGVTTSLWRQWMLQLTTFLSFQNGTILDGLTLWKKNVDKRFEGVEECMVCFSVIHGSNYSLPTISCKTCKKKFHPVCLYKWFSTSGKSTCPLCRNIF